MNSEPFLNLIAAEQNADGSFCHMSSSRADFSNAQTYTSPFFTALILDCLVDVDYPQAAPIKEKTADFLLSQLSTASSVNYWVRNSAEAQKMPYPDDLDDTMLTLAALYRYDASRLSTEQILATITLLTTLEMKPGGPYRTWVTDSDDVTWRDVDLAVNANVAYFLSLLKVENQVLSRYIRQAVAQSAVESPYYPTPWPILFYLSRVVTGRHRTSVFNLAVTSLPATQLDTALLVLTFINLKAPLSTIQPLVNDLENLTPDIIQPAPFCFDPAINTVPQFAGNRAVTAAFCLTALNRYETYAKSLQQKKFRHTTEQHLLRIVDKECVKISGHRNSPLFKELQQVNHDYQSHRILLAAHDFERALLKNPIIRPDAAELLGVANLFGWYAYSIFDDIMDDNQSHERLSLALRARDVCVQMFDQAFDDPDYRDYVSQTLVKTHDALITEMQLLRFTYEFGAVIPINFQQPFPIHILADRAFGHVLGPLGLFHELVRKDDSLFHELESFYHHFLITRQMLDDAHDWKEDFMKGQLNSVSYALLRELKITTIEPNTVDTLHDYFWETHFPVLCEQMLENVALCSRSANKLSSLINQSYLTALLAPLEKQVTKSLQSHKTTKELIARVGGRTASP